VPLVAVILGVLLMALTLVLRHSASATAWIPFGFGVVFVILGALAFRPTLRKHVMHLAAALGLIGFLGAAVRAIPAGLKLLKGTEVNHSALASQSAMAALCLVFLILCVRSFVMSRRSQARRRAAETAEV
jgi:phosphoglycerate dehydrogenase-like enzyme